MRYIALVFTAVLLSACSTPTPTNTTTTSNASNSANSSPAAQTLTVVDAPQRIKDQMASRGEQDSAQPTLKIVEPAANATVSSSTVKVKLEISGDLKGYMPHKDPQTQMGNHIHVILDNQPYEAYYELGQPFELRNVADGEHTLRVFPSRPWHESYKNNGAFQMVKFTVRNGGANANQPATTNSGQQMSNANSNANTAPTAEGKDMQNSTAGPIDAAKPLLTYSRPKGEYRAAEADPIMIDFWLANAQLKGDGGQYRVRYSVDGGEPKYIDKWGPVWLSGWTAGKHSVKLELVDEDGGLVDNGGYNSTTREITVVK
jgi:PBP1b-binding outer membrane lipoprotein LpoB